MVLAFYKKQNTCYEWNKDGAIHKDGFKFLNFDKPFSYLENKTEINWIINEVSIIFLNLKKLSVTIVLIVIIRNIVVWLKLLILCKALAVPRFVYEEIIC